MSREIKFRGRRVDNGEWIYGSLLDGDIIVAGRVDADGDYIGVGEWSSVDEETVGQLTGMKDRNGKEIYEGDIDSEDVDGRRYVVYKNGSHGLQYPDDENSFDPFMLWDRVEVIGNIHENPELLEARSAIGTTE